MSVQIRKESYSDGRAYRYHISDQDSELCYVAERTGDKLPSPVRLVEFYDLEGRLSGRLLPRAGSFWQSGKMFDVEESALAAESSATIREYWRLVDRLLLRLPRYEVQLGEHEYVARGSRYGITFYEVFWPPEIDAGPPREGEAGGSVGQPETGGNETEQHVVRVGQIQRPIAEIGYEVDLDAGPLRASLIVLGALVVLIDMQLFG
jgi:hypothetical protein